MVRILSVFAMVILLSFVLIGCEGEEGPAGPQGEKGDTGQKADPYTYVGNNGEECAHCHGDKVDSWMGTHHSNAYADLVADGSENDPYCVQCHTTGFDATVTFGDTTITSPGPDLFGFDDYFGVESDEAVARRESLANVQCEACHGALGPLDGVAAHQAEVNIGSYVTDDGEFISTCSPCHDRQLTEWSESSHANPGGGGMTSEEFNDEWGRGSCAPCHTAEGYVQANDPAFADVDFSGEYSFISCVACHDPHADDNPGQLRNVSDVVTAYGNDEESEDYPVEGSVFSGYGAGQTCAQCHHARRDTENVLGQIEEGYKYFGPHSSPQMDMFIGFGSYEIEGYDYDRTITHQTAIDDACVSCHMVRKEDLHGDDSEHIYHQFAPQGAACTPCHTELDPGDFDRNGVQTATEELMNELAVELGYADVEAFENEDTGFDSQADGVTNMEREAAYALVFVINDGSHGIHNSAYSHDLLQNAIDYLNE